MFSCPIDPSLLTVDIGKSLQALQDMTGLVFINFCQKPTIGVWPLWHLSTSHAAFDTVAPVVLQQRKPAFDYQTKSLQGVYTNLLEKQWQESRACLPSLTSSFKLTDTPLTNTEFLPFSGGLIGFVGYDYAASMQWLAQPVSSQPASSFGFYDIFLQWEPTENHWRLFSFDEDKLLESKTYLLNHLQNSATSSSIIGKSLTPVWSFEQYAAAFTKTQNYIKSGDCYQINLTQPLSGRLDKGPLSYFAAPLWALTKLPPYSSYLNLKHAQFELLSCSPESFLRFDAHAFMTARPIKGTIKRVQDEKLDALAKTHLQQSEKDKAENLMIVDMLRNDLGKTAVTGSVKVPALFNLKTFAQVHHLESTVTAIRQPNLSPLQTLFAALPGGSITGTPKKRAIEIISELEVAPRGAYCGSFGFLNLDQTGEFNILIRTLQKSGTRINLWAGGGITSQSILQNEYEECFAKVGAMAECVNTILKASA